MNWPILLVQCDPQQCCWDNAQGTIIMITAAGYQKIPH